MKIHTRNFKIGIYKKGSPVSQRLVLVLPGRLDTKDYLHMRGHVDFFAERGFLAVSMDPPGIWESGDDTEMYTISNYIKSVEEVIDYFGSKDTIILGHSMGGSVGMFVAIENKNVKALIPIMSPYKFDHLVDKVEGTYSERDVPGSGSFRKFYLPPSFYEDVLKYDARTGLGNLKIPKLFIYGKRDDVIRVKDANTEYRFSAGPKDICGINSDHDYRARPEIIQEINEIVLAFLLKNKLLS